MPLISTSINAGTQAALAKKQFEYDKEMAAIQNQYNIDMWNMQNEYNTPEQQMKRFADAGLSPQLMYGQGSNGNATSAPEQIAAGRHVPNIQLDKMNAFTSVLSAIQGIQKIKQNSEILYGMEQENFRRNLSNQDYAAQLFGKSSIFHPNRFFGIGGFGVEHVRGNRLTTGSPMEGLSDYYYKSFGNLLTESGGKAKEWKYRGNLSDMGQNIKDPFWVRMFANHGSETFTSLDNILGKGDALLAKLLNFLF